MIKLQTAIPYYLASLKQIVQIHGWPKALLLPLSHPLHVSLPPYGTFYINTFMDMWTLKEVLLNHIYDRYHRLPQHGLVVDIGAGIGDFCLLAGRTAKTVIGYDPDPNRATLCRQNLRRNHINNVSFIADTATSLDQIISRHHLKTIDFLKIDCEGCEYPLLLSASPTTLQSIKYLAAEIHLFNPKMQSQFNKLQQHLTRNGFTLKIDPNPVHSNLGYLFAQRSQQT